MKMCCGVEVVMVGVNSGINMRGYMILKILKAALV